MAKLRSDSAAPRLERFSSLATVWHRCENYERLGIKCPFRIVEERRRPEGSLPPWLVPLPAKRKQPLQGRTSEAEAVRTPGLELTKTIPFPYPLFPPPREGPKPTEPGPAPVPPGQFPVPDPAQPPFVFKEGQKGKSTGKPTPALPDGMPIIDFRGLENLQPRDVMQWLATIFDDLFKSRPSIVVPQLTALSQAKLLTPNLDLESFYLQSFVEKAQLAEQEFAKDAASLAKPENTFEKAEAIKSSSPRVSKEDILKATAATAATMTGAAAFRKWRGGGVGFQFPSMPGDPDQGLFKAP